MQEKLPAPARRNPLVALAIQRHAGTHRKSNKAMRQAARIQQQKLALAAMLEKDRL
jgi:hypothetical protein